MSVVRTVIIGMSAVIAGCAIHPLPEDTAGVPTYLIARKIRCEARDALRDNLVQWLKVAPNDATANQLGIEFENGARPLNSFSDKLFHGPVKEIVQKFENSAIAYDFSFDMTETNKLDGTFDLLRPFTGGAGSAAISAGVDRTRENVRTFTITDTFIRLLTDIKDDYCTMFSPGKNYIYPITGDIGIGEMINTFVQLSLFANLSGKSSGPPTMGDAITFTTLLSGSAAPKIVFAPVGRALQIADASITAAATRTDQHRVIVALSLPPHPTSKGGTPSQQTKVGLFVNARGTPAELAAAHTVEQVITRFELGKSAALVSAGQ